MILQELGIRNMFYVKSRILAQLGKPESKGPKNCLGPRAGGGPGGQALRELDAGSRGWLQLQRACEVSARFMIGSPTSYNFHALGCFLVRPGYPFSPPPGPVVLQTPGLDSGASWSGAWTWALSAKVDGWGVPRRDVGPWAPLGPPLCSAQFIKGHSAARVAYRPKKTSLGRLGHGQVKPGAGHGRSWWGSGPVGRG